MYRNKEIDSIKFLLIFLVVFGHFIEGFLKIFEFDLIYRFIYAFHMPVFVFFSGYLSSGKIDEKKSDGILFTIIIPFVVF